MSYLLQADVGDTVIVGNHAASGAAPFTNGVVEDPVTVTVAVTTPAGVTTTYTWAAGTVLHEAVGRFYYTLVLTSAGGWVVTMTGTFGDGTTTSETGTIYALASGADLVTLSDIEREVAQRVGPYRWIKVATGTTTSFVSLALKSTIDRGEPTPGMYLLRRGYLENGTAVPSFDRTDRVREVKDYAPLTGTVTPDQQYAVAVATNEMVELHHLHPDNLREAVRAGLRRCYFPPEAVDITLASAGYERDLTSQVSWLTTPAQVYDALAFTAGSPELARSLRWWEPISKSGALWLRTAPDPYPSTLRLLARRPHFTFVNGVTTLLGPTQDNDILAVDLMYAAAAGHIEAWRRNKAALAEASAEGRGVTQKEAAEEFTMQAGRNFTPPVTPRIMLSRPSRIRTMDEVVY